MSDVTLDPDTPLQLRTKPIGLVAPGAAGVTIDLHEGLEIASVAARKNKASELSMFCETLVGAALPQGPDRLHRGPVTVLGIGPGRWLFLREGSAGLADELSDALTGLASVCDQSDGYVIFEVGGPYARQMLAKGVPVDLHPDAFGPGDCAVTSIAHIGAILWQNDPAPRYEIAVFRSMADAFWHWLQISAAEFGLALGPSLSPTVETSHG